VKFSITFPVLFT